MDGTPAHPRPLPNRPLRRLLQYLRSQLANSNPVLSSNASFGADEVSFRLDRLPSLALLGILDPASQSPVDQSSICSDSSTQRSDLTNLTCLSRPSTLHLPSLTYQAAPPTPLLGALTERMSLPRATVASFCPILQAIAKDLDVSINMMRFKDGAFEGQFNDNTDPELTLQTLMSSPLLDEAEKEKLRTAQNRLMALRDDEPMTPATLETSQQIFADMDSVFNEDVRRRGQMVPEGVVVDIVDRDTGEAMGAARPVYTDEGFRKFAGDDAGTVANLSAGGPGINKSPVYATAGEVDGVEQDDTPELDK